jgi:uncharacterized membrane protein
VRGHINKKEIVKAIKAAEKNTGAEILVRVEKSCGDQSPVERAKRLFGKLGMHRTKHHNGVLIYLSLEDRKAAIYGDSGIHHHATDIFWNEVFEVMKADFTQNKFTEGLVKAVAITGEKLAKHFPKEKDDKNELRDC